MNPSAHSALARIMLLNQDDSHSLTRDQTQTFTIIPFCNSRMPRTSSEQLPHGFSSVTSRAAVLMPSINQESWLRRSTISSNRRKDVLHLSDRPSAMISPPSTTHRYKRSLLRKARATLSCKMALGRQSLMTQSGAHSSPVP